MYADALRARRQVLLGNEQVEEKGQDQGAVAEIVFCGAVRSHSGEPFLCHWNLCSLLLLFPQEGCIDFLPFLVLPSVYRTTTARRPQCFLTHCIPGIFIGDITFHLQLLSMAAEYQVNFSLLNISFASSDTPAFVTFWHYALGFQIWTVPLKWADELKVRFFAVDEVNLESDPLVVLSIHSGKYDVQHDCRSPSSKENWRHFSTQLLSQLSVFQKH